jgi:hypothetical protein
MLMLLCSFITATYLCVNLDMNYWWIKAVGWIVVFFWAAAPGISASLFSVSILHVIM